MAATAVLLTCGILLALWLGFRPLFSIPPNTALLLSVTPRVAHQGLSSEQLQKLPRVWQAALQGKSCWPVVLGAYHQTDQWYFFSFVPRWNADESFTRDRRGLVALMSERVLPQQGRAFGYLEQSSWWSDAGAAFSFWMDPREFLSGKMAHKNLQPFEGYYKQRVIYTDAIFEASSSRSLKLADISIHLPESDSNRSLASILLDSLGLSDLPFNSANLNPVQLSVVYNEPGQSGMDVVMSFGEAIKQEQARQVFGFLGLTQQRVVKLEDGTLVREKILPVSTDPAFYKGQKITTDHGPVEIIGSEIIFGKNKNHAENSLISANFCQDIKPQARFSNKAMSLFLSNFATSSEILLPAVQIGSLNKKLVFCFE